MGLYERLTGNESPRLAVHQLQAVLGEVERGQLTLGQAASILGLVGDEPTEIQALLARIVLPRECVTFGGQVALTNIGATYDAIAASQGLGSAIIQTVGITNIIFGVRVNKVGSGTQSWQLWNDTDSTEIAVIDDTGAAGVKNLSISKDFSSPLTAGIKIIRIRAKSTTAQDDPVYMGASVSIRRVALLTAVELHEILIIAEKLGSPYNSVAGLKTRLGV